MAVDGCDLVFRISIHALREEGDKTQLVKKVTLLSQYFNQP